MMPDGAVYLDFNATTPLLPEVVEAMLPYLRGAFGNPSSDHVHGLRAKQALETARSQVAALIGASPNEIVFTSCATESSNLAIFGHAATRARAARIVTSAVEHPATAEPCAELERRGWTVTRVRPRANGVVDPADVAAVLGSDVSLVTIMHANNEIGTVQPIAEIARLARAAGAVVHTDAAQSAGKIDVRVADLGVDMLSIAGHKLHAPKGVGALYLKSGTALAPVLRGAGHERGLRPGTENVAGIVGLGVACERAATELATRTKRLAALRDRLWTALSSEIPDATINGDTAQRLPNTLSVRFPRARGSQVLAATPEVAASAGSACHANDERPSAVLLALGLAAEEALQTVRLSVGISTTDEEIDFAAQALVRAWRRIATEPRS
jgi:cysteine desulfurase